MPLLNREAGRTQTTTPEVAFRTKGFPAFWEKFEDANNINPDNADYEQEVARRFEAFQKLPLVTKAIRELATERNTEFLGRAFTDEELKAVDAEIEDKVTKNLDFKSLNELSETVRKYRELPLEIAKKKEDLAQLGNKGTLEHKAMGLNFELARKDQVIREAEGSNEGMAWAKKGVETVQDLEQGLDLAEGLFVNEAAEVAAEYEKSFKGLEKVWQELKSAERSFPPTGVVLPKISSLKLGLDNLEKSKSNPTAYVDALANLNFVAKLEDAKIAIIRSISFRIGELRKINNNKKESKKYPEVGKNISDLEYLREQAGQVNIDSSLAQKVENLQNDFSQLAGIRSNLSYLESDPGNSRVRFALEQTIMDFETTAGKQLSSRLKAGFVELSQIQEKLGRTSASDEEIKEVVGHSAKGFMRRLISRDPQKKLKAQAEGAQRDIAGIEQQKNAILEKITTISEAEQQLEATKAQYDSIKGNLSLTLNSFDRLFKKSGEDARDLFNKQMSSEDIKEVIKAQATVEKLARARELAPELYGAMDSDDDDYDTSFHGSQNLRGALENYSEQLAYQVEKAIQKALGTLTADQLNPDALAVSLKGFEDSLGSLANTNQYKKIRLQAFKEVASYRSPLPNGKKAVLNQMLKEAKDKGFLTTDNLDLNGFVAAVRPQARAGA